MQRIPNLVVLANLESSLRLARNTLPELRSTQLARVAGSSDWEDAGREIRSGV